MDQTPISSQHVVPACYLKAFTREGLREGVLYVFDSHGSGDWRASTPNREGIEKNFYRRGLLPKDDLHKEFEDGYPSLLERATRGGPLTAPDQMQLLWFMVQMYVRNPSIAHSPDADRMDLFQRDFNNVVVGLAAATSEKEKSIDESICIIQNGWSVRIVENPHASWITSDNPCAIYCTSEHIPTMMVMPLTPRHFSVAVNLRYFRFKSSSLSRQDTQWLHSVSYGQRRRFGFSMFKDDLRGNPEFKMHDSHRGSTSQERLTSTFARYPECAEKRNTPQFGYSFLEILRCPC